ncbi:MAG: UDP-N-acetylglucosamine 1-carboxyvinyltransferase [Candidatus Levybacteria bacterium CG10_big_fil_rev_8_21_14_0_10_36_7]|nr:MAG: UDP-N-acetylglucosamine 1-carboxyvinyltransferase [Candidatus Levybacteria bacterium CG10_big_fil_rev_8_21_14_0_10_36_7]
MINKYKINGGKKLSGEVRVSGAKNAVLKALIAACLTDEEVVIENVPLISDLHVMLELLEGIGGKYTLIDHTLKIKLEKITSVKLPLDIGAKTRTSSMFLAPLLSREKEAIIPNPGGCRIGARPIDRHIEGLMKMGVETVYDSEDGYFHAKTKGLKGAVYRFEKNTHTGTETLLMAAVLAKGITVLENAAQEPEVEDLIYLLNAMGAKITRPEGRTIKIEGVEKLHGATYSVMPDRNEVVTFAIASALTGGQIWIKNVIMDDIKAFLKEFKKAGGSWEEGASGVRFFIKEKIKPLDVITAPHPGFMTDWQGPWAVLMTQAKGISRIHETVYENRFSYVEELEKMGAKMKMYKVRVKDPEKFYNFNFDGEDGRRQGLRIYGKTKLHNAVLSIADLRAGATLVLASLLARGESVIYGIEYLERGYESFDKRLRNLGADVVVEEE